MCTLIITLYIIPIHTVECVFAVEQNTCTVFLVLDDREFVIKENFTGEWTFINLPIGRYIVQVYVL